MNKSTASISGMLLAASLTALPVSAQWELKLELESRFPEEGEKRLAFEPTLKYYGRNFYTHLEFEKQFYPESEEGQLEWEYEHLFKREISDLSVKHELVRDLDRDETTAELTPRWYYKKSKTLKLGFDLEIDYYDSSASSEFEFFEIELEPTIVWTRKLQGAKFSAELEAPVTRLYTADGDDDNVGVVGWEAILKYSRNVTEANKLEAVLRLPYDSEENELEPRLELSIRFGL